MDYKILLFALIYLFFTYIYLKLLRNIGGAATIGCIWVVVIIFIFFLARFRPLRNIKKGEEWRGEVGKPSKKIVHFFGMGLIPVMATIFSFVRIAPILAKEALLAEESFRFTNERVSFDAFVHGEPDKKYIKQTIYLKQLQDVFVEGQFLDKNHGFILTRVDNYENFTIGQVCHFGGTLVQPENFDEFDYKQYLRNQRVFYILEDPTYDCLPIDEKREGSAIRNFLIDLKNNLIEKIDNTLHEHSSSLLAGILFGQDRRLEKEFEVKTRITGVSHITAASGYNITILVIAVNKLLFFLPKKVKILLSLGIIWCFALLSGLSSSIIRACIMSSLSLMAIFFGRESVVHITTPLVCLIFVILDPLIILDVGFSLSVSAILGLTYLLPIFEEGKEAVIKRLTKKGKGSGLKLQFLDDYILPTLSCTISTLPVSVFNFKTLSVWSLPVNAVVLPVVEGTMLWGVLSLGFYKTHEGLSQFFFTVVDLQLKFFEYIVNLVGGLGVGYWELSPLVSTFVSVCIFSVIFLSVIYFYPIENEQYNHYLKNS
ncbi:MAG: ComEC/Rec2 family competence protein [Candidatus Dojkabacteria bacterium]